MEIAGRRGSGVSTTRIDPTRAHSVALRHGAVGRAHRALVASIRIGSPAADRAV